MIVVVIPAFRVKKHILDVISGIGDEVDRIIVVDDACPENSGRHVTEHCDDNRIEVLFHAENTGVGGAVITGYRRSLELGATIVVKVDGDGQMDTSLISQLVRPIVDGAADYCKGNRFFSIDELLLMPKMRLLGNSVLSLANKFVNGYWNLMDPTNGFTAIGSDVLRKLPLHKIHRRYFFESDMLFRLGLYRAVVIDIPMQPIYADEVSNLRISRVLLEFPPLYLNRAVKRILYMYFIRDFHAASVELILGLVLIITGAVLGIQFWHSGSERKVFTSSGSVMLSALPVILGFQLVLSALNFDIQNVPRRRSASHNSVIQE
jgi:glycosyltransferase involved in cell wall biosynthesis